MQRGFQGAVIGRTGEMGAETPLPSSGRLEGASVPEILRLAGDAALTGSLVFERDGIQKVLYLREGRVVFAASRDTEDRLGTLLLRRGQVGLVPLLEASGEIASGRRLGQILIEHGVMTADEVARAVLDQVREIALSVFSWRRGEWRVSPVALPGDEPLTLDVGTEELVLTGVRRMRDWRWIRRSVGGPRAVYRAASPQPEGEPPLTLTERSILERLEEPLRVDELCDQVYAPSYDIYRSVWALTILGRLARVEPRRVERRPSSPEEGWLDARGGASGLVLELGEKRFSGVVRLFSGETEGSMFLRDGRVAFATTRDPEMSLLSHLLRRGVISDRDHEEAVRRLISGKRVGTLLAERGAIGSEEVATFVREQVLDVAKSLVMLEDGEYEIEEGLPSQEDVLLDRSPEEIVLAAIEASERFHAVWRSFRDLNVLFRLAPGHLARLDRMQVRPLVWDLVALLAEERTLRELLAARPEPDFEICRLLHGLERTRIVVRVSQDEILRRARMAIQELSSRSEVDSTGPAAEVIVSGGAPIGALEDADDVDEGDVVFDSAGPTAPPVETEATPATSEDDPAERAIADGHAASFSEGDEVLAEGETHAAADDSAEIAHAAEDPAEVIEGRTAAQLAPELFAPDDATEAGEVAAVGPESDREPDEADDTDDTDEARAEGAVPAGVAVPVEFEPADELDEIASDDGTAVAEPDEQPDAAPEAESDESAPDPAATVEMSRESVEAAIANAREDDETEAPAPADDVVEDETGDPAPEPDEDDDTDVIAIDPFVYEVVDRFNERHAIVYAGLKPEIGAGIRNYVVTCCGRLGEDGRAFENVDLDDDGRFDRDALARSLSEVAPHEPSRPLDALIAGEIETVRGFVAAARIDRIESELAERD